MGNYREGTLSVFLTTYIFYLHIIHYINIYVKIIYILEKEMKIKVQMTAKDSFYVGF